MAVPAILHDLIEAGVEFETDGKRIRWRNAGGRVTAAVVHDLRTHKAEIISFLTGAPIRSERLGLPPHIAAAVAAAFADYAATDNPHDERAWQ